MKKTETKMEAQTIKKLLKGDNLTTDEVNEVINQHILLFGDNYPYDLKDGVAISFFGKRVASFFAGEKSIMQTHNDYLQDLKDNPPKTVKQLLSTDVITKKEFQILAENHTKLFGADGYSFEYSVDGVNRLKKKLQGYYDGDLSTLKYHQDYKESLIIKDSWTLAELYSKVDTTPDEDKLILKNYKKLYPEATIGDLTVKRTMRLIKYKLKQLL